MSDLSQSHSSLPPNLINSMMSEALTEATKRVRSANYHQRFYKYQNDPLGFCRDVLHSHFTEDIEEVILSVRDNPVTIAQSSNAVGKTHGAAHVAHWFYLCFPNSQVYCTAAPPLDNLKRLLWGEILAVVQRNQSIFRWERFKSLSIERIDPIEHTVNPKVFIAGVAIPTSGSAEDREAKFSGKHAPNLLFIVDEGDAVPEEVYKGIEACTSGGMNRLLILFNPRGKRGPIYHKQQSRAGKTILLSALDHPNVVSGKEIIPGAVDREKTLRRINEWTRPLAGEERPGLETFEVPDFLVGASTTALDGTKFAPLEAGHRKIINPAFYYMVLGLYPAQSEQQLISEEWISRARTRWDTYVATYGEIPPQNVRPIMGVDVAELGIDANVACFRHGGWVAKLVTWSGMDTYATGDRALQLYYEKNPVIAMIDATGYGSSVAPHMSRKGRDQNVRAVSVNVSDKPLEFIQTEMGEFFALRDQLWWATREWLRTDNTAMLPPDQLLIEELSIPTYEVRETDRKIKVMSKDAMRSILKRSPDRADSLILTFAPYRRATVMRLVTE